MPRRRTPGWASANARALARRARLSAGGLALVATALTSACEFFPLEVDTPQLNEVALENLKTAAASGTCKAGVFQGNVTGGKDFTGQCTIQGNLYISGEATDLLRLRNVREVQGAIYVTGEVDLADAVPNLEKCSGILAGGYLGTKLTGPPLLKSATALNVEKTGKLMTISGFDNVASMTIYLKNNAELTTVSGFGKLTSGAITVEDNPKLATFGALPSLTESVALSFQRNPLLLELPACPALQTVTGDIQVRTMPGSALTGFSALQSVGGLKLTQMPNLASLQVPALATAGTIWLVDLQKLNALTGLPKVMVSGLFSACNLAVCQTELDGFAKAHVVSGQAKLCDFWTPCTP